MNHPPSNLALLFRAGTIACALPVCHVAEIMRPLRIEPLADAPEFVLGISIVRGAPVPVVDVRVLLGTFSGRPAGRFVMVRAGDRCTAFAVDAVFGVLGIEQCSPSAMPPLLSGARNEIVERLGVLDAQLILVLKVGNVVPGGVWDELMHRAAAS